MFRSNVTTKDSSENSLFILPVLMALIFGYILWQIFQSPVIQILKSLIGGLLLIYYSWELTYFDSIAPGVMPASPLSPSNIKYVTCVSPVIALPTVLNKLVLKFETTLQGIWHVTPVHIPSSKVAGHTLHLSNAIALINGAFLALFINWWA